MSTTVADTSTQNVQHVLNYTQKGLIVSGMADEEMWIWTKVFNTRGRTTMMAMIARISA